MFEKLPLSLPSPLTKINDPVIDSAGVELWLKRDDLIHPVVSGNKWRKLKYLLLDAQQKGQTHIISMGGPYSNHLHALAYVGKQLGLATTGLVRGFHRQPSATLVDLKTWGMTLEFVSREEFRQLRQYRHWDDLPAGQYQGYWVPEGGYNPLALKGIGELVSEIDTAWDIIVTPCGTGTTLAGLIAAMPTGCRALGFSALKADGYLDREVTELLAETLLEKGVIADWSINHDYHFGGFARQQPELNHFMTWFEGTHRVSLDPVYTGKMLYGLWEMIKNGQFAKGSRIVALHTGGLQGRSRA